MTQHIIPGVSERDNETWLSLRNLREGLERAGNRIWVHADPPFKVLIPLSWSYGYIAFAFGLPEGQSTNVTADLWKFGASAAVNLFTAETVENTGTGFQYVDYTYYGEPLGDAWASLEWTYTGTKRACALFLKPGRRR